MEALLLIGSFWLLCEEQTGGDGEPTAVLWFTMMTVVRPWMS